MAFAIDRVEAARRLSLSTRTVDRHIKSGKIRTKRIGKKMFLHEEDVESLRISGASSLEDDYIVIHEAEDSSEHEIIHPERRLSKEESPDFAHLYSDSQKIIAKKDDIIQDLSYRLWKTETELKNAIPLIEYRKATFLLESAKNKTDTDASILGTKIEFLEKEINKRNSTIMWLAMLFVLVLAFAVVFVLYMKMVGIA